MTTSALPATAITHASARQSLIFTGGDCVSTSRDEARTTRQPGGVPLRPRDPGDAGTSRVRRGAKRSPPAPSTAASARHLSGWSSSTLSVTEETLPLAVGSDHRPFWLPVRSTTPSVTSSLGVNHPGEERPTDGLWSYGRDCLRRDRAVLVVDLVPARVLAVEEQVSAP